MPRRSPFTSVTPALSIATSVPVPIAMPTWAWASAGASLMPSPAIATMRPAACSALDRRGLAHRAARRRPPRRCRAASRRPAAVVALSPVSMTSRRPSRLQRRNRLRRARLDRVRHADEAGQRPVDRDEHHGLSMRAQGLGSAGERATRPTPAAPRTRGCRATTVRPSTRPRTPLPVTDSNVSALGRVSPRAVAPSTIAAASGCSLPCSSLAASASQDVIASRRGLHGHERGLAFGQRAGLVDDERVDRRAAPRSLRRSGTARPSTRRVRSRP